MSQAFSGTPPPEQVLGPLWALLRSQPGVCKGWIVGAYLDVLKCDTPETTSIARKGVVVLMGSLLKNK